MKRKENKGNFPATILTSCLVNRGFTIYGPNDENLCLLDQRSLTLEIPRGSFLLVQVAHQNTVFASSCPLANSAV